MKKSLTSDWLMHHGIQGQKWGVRNGPPYPIGSSPRKVFISGTSKFNGALPEQITYKLDKFIEDNNHILIGDAPGIDTEVQKYLASKKYKNVSVYTIEESPRFIASTKLGWGVNKVQGKEQVNKDEAMSKDAHFGFAVVLENGSRATRKNIDRLNKSNKDSDVLTIFEDGSIMSTDTNINKKTKSFINKLFDQMNIKDKLLLYTDWKSGKKLFGKNEYTTDSVAYSITLSKRDNPIGFLMVGRHQWKDTGETYGDVGLGISNTNRGKGYGKLMANQLVNWYDKKDHDLTSLEWTSRKNNPASYKTALSAGFKIVDENDEYYYLSYK